MMKTTAHSLSHRAMGADQLDPFRSTTSALFSEAPLLVARTFFSFFYTIVFILHVLNGPEEPYLFVAFLTYLSYYGVFAYVLVSTYLSWRSYLYPYFVPWQNFHWLFKFLYFLHYELNTLLAFVVTVVYWSLLASDDLAGDHSPGYLFLSISMHAINSVIMWSEVILGNNPILLRHFPLVLFITLLYVLCAIFLHARYDVWIYPFLDYVTDPKATVFTILGIIIISSSFYIASYSLHLARDKYANKHEFQQPCDITA